VVSHANVKAYDNGFKQMELLNMQTLTASEARANLYRLMDQTAESHQPIHIAGKRNSAVLLSGEDWQAIQETLFLLSVPGMRESIKEGMAEPLNQSATELDW
jgi:prevent-host-death family protein